MSNSKLALLAAGLGMMGGQSPYFMTNVGQGGLQGIKTLQDFQQMDAERQARAMQAYMESQRINIERQNADLAQDMRPLQRADEIMKAIQLGLTDPEVGRQQLEALHQQYPNAAIPVMPGEKQAPDQALMDIKPAYDSEDQAKYAVKKDFLPAANPEDFYPSLQYKFNWEKAQKAADKTMADQQKSYNSAQSILGQSYEINKLYDKSMKENPNFLKPGAFNQERTDWANRAVTLGQAIVGMPPDTHVLEAIGINQAMQKLSTRSGFDLARTLGTREAMQVIQQAMTAVANGSMPEAGFKTILYNVMASAHREVDRYDYLKHWQDSAAHHTLEGAENYFDTNIGPQNKYVDMTEKLAQLDAARRKATPEQLETLKKNVKDVYGYTPEMYGG